MTFVVLMIAVQHAVARAQLGVATSALQFSRSIGAAIGTGAMGGLITWWLGRRLATGNEEVLRLTGGHADISAIVLGSSRAALSPEASAFLRQALAGSLRLAFVFVLASTVAGAVVAFFIPAGPGTGPGAPGAPVTTTPNREIIRVWPFGSKILPGSGRFSGDRFQGVEEPSRHQRRNS